MLPRTAGGEAFLDLIKSTSRHVTLRRRSEAAADPQEVNADLPVGRLTQPA